LERERAVAVEMLGKANAWAGSLCSYAPFRVSVVPTGGARLAAVAADAEVAAAAGEVDAA
jgi:hypothetical protein